MIYFAYGSNTNSRVMRMRCPSAKPLGKFWLRSSQLVFRSVADCVYQPGAKCPGVLWRISKEDEERLDRAEGINSGAYRKVRCELRGFPGETELMLYVMESDGIMPPSETYFTKLREGYREFKLPLSYLNKALDASWDGFRPLHRERKRYRRDGRPRLAQPKSGSLATGNEASI